MIAAEVSLLLAPRHTQAGDHRARIGPVLVHLENGRREIGLAPDIGRARRG